ncbi:hypothetical protein MMC07_003675 [Pseudocyphellaria aurata]|nr:hypothetical protein [Pseudocyphellaria aurata]
MIKGRRKSAVTLQKEIMTACATSQKTLLVIDTLIPLASLPSSTFNLPHFLSSLLLPNLSLIATYHVDVPIPHSSTSIYTPSSLNLLQYLASTVLTTHSFPQTLARKRAADKSLAEPLFGIAEERDGVVVGMGANDTTALVVEMEHRRKSGRGMREWFFVPLRDDHATLTPNVSLVAKNPPPGGQAAKIILLEDHPLWHPQGATAPQPAVEDDGPTFELGLTAQQRLDREHVVLPYFDAQRADGGEGGRILYEMGIEDDFDEEEDEI